MDQFLSSPPTFSPKRNSTIYTGVRQSFRVHVHICAEARHAAPLTAICLSRSQGGFIRRCTPLLILMLIVQSASSVVHLARPSQPNHDISRIFCGLYELRTVPSHFSQLCLFEPYHPVFLDFASSSAHIESVIFLLFVFPIYLDPFTATFGVLGGGPSGTTTSSNVSWPTARNVNPNTPNAKLMIQMPVTAFLKRYGRRARISDADCV